MTPPKFPIIDVLAVLAVALVGLAVVKGFSEGWLF